MYNYRRDFLNKHYEEVPWKNKAYYKKDKISWIQSFKHPKKEIKPCNLVDEFAKLSLTEEDRKFVRKAEIYQIEHSYPGRKFKKWKQTSNATFYKKGTVLKVYCSCANL